MRAVLWLLLTTFGACQGGTADGYEPGQANERCHGRCECDSEKELENPNIGRAGQESCVEQFEHCAVTQRCRVQVVPNWYYRRPYDYRQAFDYPWHGTAQRYIPTLHSHFPQMDQEILDGARPDGNPSTRPESSPRLKPTPPLPPQAQTEPPANAREFSHRRKKI